MVLDALSTQEAATVRVIVNNHFHKAGLMIVKTNTTCSLKSLFGL